MMVNDSSRVMVQILPLLKSVIYNRKMFIVQATDAGNIELFVTLESHVA